MYNVEILNNDSQWQEFISKREDASQYHSLKWRDVILKSFGHKPVYLVAKEDNIVKGVLPLFLMESIIFGKFLISMPFLNYGGLCVDNMEAGKVLIEKAIDIAKGAKVRHIELRHCENFNLDLQLKKNKVTMIMELQPDSKVFWDRFKPKVRNHIRKAEKNGLSLQAGGMDQLENFYSVFSQNMRDLGTPVYSKAFFKNILEEFPGEAKIFSVFLKDKVVASGFTIGFRNTLEIPWASSIRRYNNLSSNVFMYWEIIKYACASNFKYFDFGRCSWNSNTFIFKKEWGAQPKQLYWYYWLPNGGSLPELNPSNPKYAFFIETWKRLPLFLTKKIGPGIIKFIP